MRVQNEIKKNMKLTQVKSDFCGKGIRLKMSKEKNYTEEKPVIWK